MFHIITMLVLTFAPAPKPVAQFQPCVWPNKCVVTPTVFVAGGPVTTCQWPNTCG